MSCGYTRLIHARKDSYEESLRLRIYENGKVLSDKRISNNLIHQHYRMDANNTNLINTNNSGLSSNIFNDSEPSLSQPTVGTPGGLSLKNAPSLSSLIFNNEPVSAGAQLNIYLYLIEPIHKAIAKKKIENQVKFFKFFSLC